MNSNTTIITSLLLALGTSAVADDIILKRSVRMRHDDRVVTLGDVATIDGTHVAPYADLEVAIFEDRTRPLELTVRDIEFALERAGANRARFDLTGNRIVVRPFAGRNPASRGPAACTPLELENDEAPDGATTETPVVDREQEVTLNPRAVLTEDTPRGLISERMLNAAAIRGELVRLRIQIEDPALLSMHDARPSLVVTGPAADGATGFRIMLDGEYAGTAVASLEVKSMIYRARVDMKRGERVDVDDVSIRSEWMSAERSNRTSIAPMIGSTLDSRVAVDTVLEPDHFTPVIKRNTPIKVRSGGTGWSMMLDCIALEEGRLGQTIMVRSDTPGKPARDARPIRVLVESAGQATLVN
jgi:flagella basal body P-ring formation protein FlgA